MSKEINRIKDELNPKEPMEFLRYISDDQDKLYLARLSHIDKIQTWLFSPLGIIAVVVLFMQLFGE